MKNSSFIIKLLSCRLFWYRTQIIDKLIRFKHVVVILIALFIAPLHLLDALFVRPIINIGYSAKPDGTPIFSLLLIQTIYLCWIMFQEDAVFNVQVRKYFNTLPISSFQHYIVDIVTLVLANNIFWIPIIAALINAPYTSMTNLYVFSLFILNMLVLTISILAIQMQWVYRRYFSFIFLFITDFLFYLSSIITTSWLSLLLISVSFFSAVFFTYPWFLRISMSNRLIKSRRADKPMNLARSSRFRLLKLSYSVLTKNYFIEYFIRCFLSVAILLFGCFAILLGDSLDARFCSVCLLSIIALVFSGFFPLLKESREKYNQYFNSLPIKQIYWYMVDYLAIALPIAILGAFYAFVLMWSQKLDVVTIIEIVTSSGILALILCYIRNKYQKFNALFSIMITVAWIAIFSYR